jgi:hypothetical protein
MINDKVDPFITQYRDSLERERDLSFQNLDNTRRNDFGTIMGNANTSGMMYSNFPERTKIQYDTTNYMPNQTKIQNTYQTGLDKLRSNVVSLSNQLKDVNDAIADLNKTGSSGTSGTRSGNEYSPYLADYLTANSGYQFKDAAGNPIRANTWARANGYNVWDVVYAMAQHGDANAKHALAGYNNAKNELTDEEAAAFGALGISTEGYGHRD